MSIKIGTLTRAISIDALTHILTRNCHSDVALQKLFKSHPKLRSLDKAFIYEIVFGALRWLSKMDWIMSHVVDRPLISLDPRVMNALRVGVYQIYYMDRVPARAAVAETVEAIKNVGVPNAASFVNAILRRISKKSEYFPKPDKETKYLEYCAMQYAHPLWIITRWAKQLSKDKFEYLISNNNNQPKFTLKRIFKNPLPGDDQDFSAYLLRTFSLKSQTKPLRGTFSVDTLPRFETCEAFKAGCYIVQQESAQLCCHLLSFQKTDKVLDACAAPGGKSIFLWEQGVLPENLTVCDFSQKRIKLIHENFERVGLNGAKILHGDAVEQCKDQRFDKILLDAPCSALGIVRRHPEIKWQRTLRDIEICVQNQKKLLDGLAPLLNVGGEMVYVVCSFEPEETTKQIDAFLANHPEFQIESIDNRVHDFYRKYVTKHNELIIYGGNTDELDGFYAVVLKKFK
jgi:16S rRNA (cytosine967-C5)-methyltransferase